MTAATTLTPAAFILARLADDEAAALAVPMGEEYRVEASTPDASPWLAAEHYQRHDPARVLAECEAKRRIVEGWQTYAAQLGEPDDERTARTLELVLRFLCQPYADHPDFQEEWHV